MLGFSWAEIMLTAAVALVVIGPKDIPKVMFEIGRVVRRLRYVQFALSRQFEDFLREHDLQDLHKDMHEHVNFEAPKKINPDDPVMMPKDGHE